METVAQPPDGTEVRLLTQWGSLDDRSRGREATVLSIAVHAGLIIALAMVPKGTFVPRQLASLERVTPLVAPPELTQREPNKRKISKEFNASEEAPRPRIQVPRGAPSTTRPQAARPAPFPTPPVPNPEVATPLPEPPKVETAVPRQELPQIAQAAPPPPQIQPVEKPKLAFETPSAPPTPLPPGQGRIAVPSASVSEAIRQTVRGTSGGLTVGDPGISGPGGYGEGVNLPPAPGIQGSSLELLSDPLGVDFRPYLLQVLAAVRRNWMAVIPESAKLGRRGRVSIQFSIGKNGSVPKLVIASGSGTDALDRAAVAGISASNPFPPLPSEFKGDRVVLQFSFAYNMPRR
jgi:TonB family protein